MGAYAEPPPHEEDFTKEAGVCRGPSQNSLHKLWGGKFGGYCNCISNDGHSGIPVEACLTYAKEWPSTMAVQYQIAKRQCIPFGGPIKGPHDCPTGCAGIFKGIGTVSAYSGDGNRNPENGNAWCFLPITTTVRPILPPPPLTLPPVLLTAQS